MATGFFNSTERANMTHSDATTQWLPQGAATKPWGNNSKDDCRKFCEKTILTLYNQAKTLCEQRERNLLKAESVTSTENNTVKQESNRPVPQLKLR